MFGNKKEQRPHDVMPIPHDRGSAFNTVAGSTATEGLKGAGKGIVSGALIGALVLGSLAFLISPVGLPVLGSALSSIGSTLGLTAAGGGLTVGGMVTVAMVTVGAAIGAMKGLGIGGILGGGLGMFKGFGKGQEKVDMERGAAIQVQHQLGAAAMETQAMMAQAQAMGHRNAASAYAGGLPPQGSPMNMASSQINAAEITDHSRLADMQLQRA